MTLEEQNEIKSFCDERYVRKDVCNERRDQFDKKLANDDKRIEVIAHDFGVFKRLLWLIAGAVTTEVVVLIADMILK